MFNLVADVLPIPGPTELMFVGGVVVAVFCALAAGVYFVIVRAKKPRNADERADQK